MFILSMYEDPYQAHLRCLHFHWHLPSVRGPPLWGKSDIERQLLAAYYSGTLCSAAGVSEYVLQGV